MTKAINAKTTEKITCPTCHEKYFNPDVDAGTLYEVFRQWAEKQEKAYHLILFEADEGEIVEAKTGMSIIQFFDWTEGIVAITNYTE